jgi:hypothetical protein
MSKRKCSWLRERHGPSSQTKKPCTLGELNVIQCDLRTGGKWWGMSRRGKQRSIKADKGEREEKGCKSCLSSRSNRTWSRLQGRGGGVQNWLGVLLELMVIWFTWWSYPGDTVSRCLEWKAEKSSWGCWIWCPHKNFKWSPGEAIDCLGLGFLCC